MKLADPISTNMDSHVCGPCGQHFSQMEDFVAHKKSDCKRQNHVKNTKLGADVRLGNLTFKALMERKCCYNAIKSHLRVRHNYPSIEKFQEKVLNPEAFNKKYKVAKVKELDRELRELKGEKAPRETRKRSKCKICRKGRITNLRNHLLNSHDITSLKEYKEFLAKEDAVADSAYISSLSSYCEICKKGLCNVRYKIEHMMKKHGIDVTALDQVIPPSETNLPNSSDVVNVSHCEICQNGLFLNEIYRETHMRQMHGNETTGTNTAVDPLDWDVDPLLANVESIIVKEENVPQELAQDTFIG